MDDKVLELLMVRISEQKEFSQQKFNALGKDINEIKNDVKALSQWKWKLGGAQVVMGFVFTIAFEIGKLIFDHL